jgi:hypothetical protein
MSWKSWRIIAFNRMYHRSGRHFIIDSFYGRGAGVDDQARLESACRLKRPWVRIPPSPLFVFLVKGVFNSTPHYDRMATLEARVSGETNNRETSL